MTSLYQVVLPTTVEPSVNGWSPNDRCVFLMNHVGNEIKPGSVRLNGILSLVKTVSGSGVQSITTSDKLNFNPNAGINGLFHTIGTKFGSAVVENIVDFGKYVAMKNESSYYQMDHGVNSDAMMELMSYSNDGYSAGDDLKANITTGLLFPPDALNELPFSVDLDIVVNNASAPLPFSKTGEIEISILLQDMSKTGITCDNIVAGTTYSYNLKNLELRYMAQPEQPQIGAIICQVKGSAHIPTIRNKINALEFSATNAFDSVVASFLDTSKTIDSTLRNDYLATCALTPLIDYLEIKINGQDDGTGPQYPLRFQTAEILYNALLSWNAGNINDEFQVKKHGLSYAKLANGTGFGIGCALPGHNAGTRVCFNVSLQSAPVVPFNAYFFTIGKLIL